MFQSHIDSRRISRHVSQPTPSTNQRLEQTEEIHMRRPSSTCHARVINTLHQVAELRMQEQGSASTTFTTLMNKYNRARHINWQSDADTPPKVPPVQSGPTEDRSIPSSSSQSSEERF